MAARAPDDEPAVLDGDSLVPDLAGVPEDDGAEPDDANVTHAAGAALDREQEATP